MKITTLIIALVLIIASVTTLNAENNKINHQDQEVKMPEEPYVNDVPFDTKTVVEEKSEPIVLQIEQVELEESPQADNSNLNLF